MRASERRIASIATKVLPLEDVWGRVLEVLFELIALTGDDKSQLLCPA